jgi:hypothetical protein
MNAVLYLQSQKAIQQAEGVVKLILLAFFFVPLSFTTSFFGMNFNELNRYKSIWTWFAVSGPLLLLSFLFWRFDIFKILKSCMRFVSHLVESWVLLLPEHSNDQCSRWMGCQILVNTKKLFFKSIKDRVAASRSVQGEERKLVSSLILARLHNLTEILSGSSMNATALTPA